MKIGRLGGDEFVLLLPWTCDDPRTSHLARQCINAISTPFELPNGDASVGLSMGIAAIRPQDDFSTALARADQAMYRVKRSGKRGFTSPSQAASRCWIRSRSTNGDSATSLAADDQAQLRCQRRSRRPRRPQSSNQLLSNTRNSAGLAWRDMATA